MRYLARFIHYIPALLAFATPVLSIIILALSPGLMRRRPFRKGEGRRALSDGQRDQEAAIPSPPAAPGTVTDPISVSAPSGCTAYSATVPFAPP
jgi:hypothetical protein